MNETRKQRMALLEAEVKRLRALILDIEGVATGEWQVADDDTGGMEWIAERIRSHAVAAGEEKGS